MACSKLKSLNLSVVLIERYFNLVYLEYGTLFPEDASWKEVEKTPSLNGLTRTLQEVPSILFKIADLFEDARVEELVKKCERLRLNSGNIHSRFMETITTLLDDGLSWGKVVVFFSFSVSFAIYLCTNEMSHLAARVCVWAAQILEDRLEPWVNQNGGWVSSRNSLFYCLRAPRRTITVISFHCDGMSISPSMFSKRNFIR